MLFNSYEFIFCFVPFSVALFFILGKKDHRLAILWLVVGSLYFYGWWEWIYIALIIISIVFNYFIGELLRPRPGTILCTRKAILIFGIIFNLVLLGYFKYSSFFIDNLNDLFSTNFSVEKIILPLAISFFTFQQITYLVDMYRGEIRGQGILKYCLFVTFFPQLIAGPIVRCQRLMPQLVAGALGKLSRETLWSGLCLFSLGLFKKTCLADGMRPLADEVFAAAQDGTILSLAEAWTGATAFGLQIYFDFSAYSEMALGLGLLFGLRLPLNFDSPYKATNIIEFWRRWHITLSEFLRDYLYKPLGGNRSGVTRGIVNIFIVMALGGLWRVGFLFPLTQF